MIPNRLLPVLCGFGIAACASASAVPLTEQGAEQQQILGDVTGAQPSGQLSGRFLHITGTTAIHFRLEPC
jgi:hypothetical protein